MNSNFVERLMDARGLRGVGMCLRGVFWRWMAINRAQVAAIERGLCGSLPQRWGHLDSRPSQKRA